MTPSALLASCPRCCWRGGHWAPGLQLVEELGADCLVVTENRGGGGTFDADGLLWVSGTQVTSVLTEGLWRGEGWKVCLSFL